MSDTGENAEITGLSVEEFSISFNTDSNHVGTLRNVGGSLVFEGSAEKSAKALFDCVIAKYDREYTELEKQNAVLREDYLELYDAAKNYPYRGGQAYLSSIVMQHEEVEADLQAAGIDCCGNPAQCWEPCGDLGKSEEHAKVVDIELPGMWEAADFLGGETDNKTTGE